MTTTDPNPKKEMTPRERAIAATAFVLWEYAGARPNSDRDEEFWNAAVLIVDNILLTCSIKVRTFEVHHA